MAAVIEVGAWPSGDSAVPSTASTSAVPWLAMSGSNEIGAALWARAEATGADKVSSRHSPRAARRLLS